MNSSHFSLSFAFDEQESKNVVLVSGDLDFATVPALQRFLSELTGEVVIDCEGLTFLDSAGIGLFIRADGVCRDRGDRFIIRNLSANGYKVLEISGLTDFLDIETSRSRGP